MSTCDNLNTALMRDLMHDIHNIANATDDRITQYRNAYLNEHPTLRDHDQSAQRRHALHAHAARELRAFLAAVATIGNEHHNRIIP